jgi:hypothetical protein
LNMEGYSKNESKLKLSVQNMLDILEVNVDTRL